MTFESFSRSTTDDASMHEDSKILELDSTTELHQTLSFHVISRGCGMGTRLYILK